MLSSWDALTADWRKRQRLAVRRGRKVTLAPGLSREPA